MAESISNPQTQILAVVSLPGLRPTSLGNYLATLGLHRIAARNWPKIRLAWRDDVPHLVGGGNFGELTDYLLEVGKNADWTSYQLLWATEQKKGTKSHSAEPVALWRAEADEVIVGRLDAHLIAASKQIFNPLLGSGGNAGKRNFAQGWAKASESLQKQFAPAPAAKRSKRAKTSSSATPNTKQNLMAWLNGEAVSGLEQKLQGASWFSDANKLFNSGQSAAREGAISPWAMLLACESIDCFSGKASRRLGARTRAMGAFPFVTAPAAATHKGEAGRDRGEVWAPLWERPATVFEVQALFARGRAEIGGRGAKSPAAFSAAILRRGTDAGISSFIRFALGATTSANTFEARRLERIAIPHVTRPDEEERTAATEGNHAAIAEALEKILALLDRLPRDTKKGKHWLYHGLRGPIEAAMIEYAAKPDDAERAQALLDKVVDALDRVDRNRAFRRAQVRWRSLPLDWLDVALGESPSVEARLAAAIVSGFPQREPFARYRFGTEFKAGLPMGDAEFIVPEVPPATWVWGAGNVVSNLVAVIDRHTLEQLRSNPQTEKAKDRNKIPQIKNRQREPWYVTTAELDSWLSRAVDDELLAVWLSRLALFDWRTLRDKYPENLKPQGETENFVSGPVALAALFSPLLDRRAVECRPEMHSERILRIFGNTDSGDSAPDDSDRKNDPRTPAVAHKLVSLLRTGQFNNAFEIAGSRYAMANARLARFDIEFTVADPARFLAGLLIPLSDKQRARIIAGRWLRPSRSSTQGV